jgi:hypothetical protein
MPFPVRQHPFHKPDISGFASCFRGIQIHNIIARAN